MARDDKGFAAFVEPMVMDGYLDVEEEIAAMMKAADFGLTGPQAEKLLVTMCQERGAVLERIAKMEFKAHITAAVGDKYLDRDELSELEQAGLEKFQDAENPSDLVDRLISEVLRLEGAYTEASLREEIESQLRPHQAQGVKIKAEDWNRIRSGAFDRLRRAGVDLEENDGIGDDMDGWLTASGLQIGGGGGKLGLIVGLVFVLGLLAVLSVGAILLLGGDESNDSSGGTTSQPVAAATRPDAPPCDAACTANLQTLFRKVEDAAENLRYTTPAGDCVKKWYGDLRVSCAAFNELSPAGQREAILASPGWEWCDTGEVSLVLKKVVDDYLTWSTSHTESVTGCEWLRRCVEAMHGNEPCEAARRDRGCR